MKILIAQTNTLPRDFDGNVTQIEEAFSRGLKTGVDLVVTPELSIPGYSVKDLMYNNGFVEWNKRWLGHVVSITKGYNTVLIVGYIDKNTSGTGKPFRNMVAVIQDGIIIATYAKRLLPFYDVFDEARYFEPGNTPTVVNIGGMRWGLAICEDVWNDKGQDDYNYDTNPLADYRKMGVYNIISVNSSPFVMGKPKQRLEMLAESFKKGTIIYANQIGGQDELIFDGHSMVIMDGHVIHVSKMTQESEPTYEVVDLNKNGIPKGRSVLAEESDVAQLKMALVVGIRDYVHKNGFKNAVVASSGGVDSACVLALAADALGRENISAIREPSEYSSDHSKNDALELHQNLGVQDFLVPIEHIELLKRYNSIFLQNEELAKAPYNKVADENIQARIRGALTMHFSNAFGALVLTTGNKSELSVGYCTIYGDMCGGLAVIGDVYKMWVYKLCRYINAERAVCGLKGIPQRILDKEPSAELRPGQKDQDSLPPYPILDPILEAYIEDYVADFDAFLSHVRNWGFSFIETPKSVLDAWMKGEQAKSVYNKMIRLTDASEFKRRQAATCLKTRRVAFGTGRRLPIAKK